ncbi:TetR family transcriptional regulator [Amycolatopsis sp.]|uniref:TetR family transcriptional regulator n=1 Tax=Amycolatopsis sp. TaxID=37632 RepID=UPI002DF7DDEF|nr:TetR family transcriptional regulator [Amycolatopsis sp.]
MTTPGRRELNKAATRQALQSAALRMFDEQGYADTTVRDIASAADVTERTFFRYFPSKEDLVLGEVLDLIPVLGARVRARPADEPPYPAVLNALLDVAAEREAGMGILFSGPPAQFLSPRTRAGAPVLFEFEAGLAEAIVSRLRHTSNGEGETALALRASVLARASVAAMRSTLIAYSALPEREKTPPELLRLIRETFAVLLNP